VLLGLGLWLLWLLIGMSVVRTVGCHVPRPRGVDHAPGPAREEVSKGPGGIGRYENPHVPAGSWFPVATTRAAALPPRRWMTVSPKRLGFSRATATGPLASLAGRRAPAVLAGAGLSR
jgi:hypothetical protein